jgi:hypothetical protein
MPQFPEFIALRFVWPLTRAIPPGEESKLFESYTGHGSSFLADAGVLHAAGSAFDRRSNPKLRITLRTRFEALMSSYSVTTVSPS